MDTLTIKYYDENAESLFALYRSTKGDFQTRLKLAFRRGSAVLDIGSGYGRDLDFLVSEQYEAYGTEPSSQLRSLAIAQFPHLEGRIYPHALPDVSANINRRFDGILCSAVFQHLPREQQPDAAFDIRNLLYPNGRLLLSFPKERPGIDASGRDEHGRLYTTLIPEAMELLFGHHGFQCISQWENPDGLGRPGFSWTTLLFSLP